MHAEYQFEVMTSIPMKQIYQQDLQVKGVKNEHGSNHPCQSQPMKSGPRPI